MSIRLLKDTEVRDEPNKLIFLNGVTSIPSNYVDEIKKSNLIYLEFPRTLMMIGSNAFSLSSISKLDLKNTQLERLQYRCFYECTSLTSILLPPTITHIENEVFYNCSSLTEITLPPSLQEVGELCFANCGELRSITMSDTIKTLGYNCFAGCPADINLGLLQDTDSTFPNNRELLALPRRADNQITIGESGTCLAHKTWFPNEQQPREITFLECNGMYDLECVTLDGSVYKIQINNQGLDEEFGSIVVGQHSSLAPANALSFQFAGLDESEPYHIPLRVLMYFALDGVINLSEQIYIGFDKTLEEKTLERVAEDTAHNAMTLGLIYSRSGRSRKKQRRRPKKNKSKRRKKKSKKQKKKRQKKKTNKK